MAEKNRQELDDIEAPEDVSNATFQAVDYQTGDLKYESTYDPVFGAVDAAGPNYRSVSLSQDDFSPKDLKAYYVTGWLGWNSRFDVEDPDWLRCPFDPSYIRHCWNSARGYTTMHYSRDLRLGKLHGGCLQVEPPRGLQHGRCRRLDVWESWT